MKSKDKKAVRDPNGPFRMQVIRDKTKYTRKNKHKSARSSVG
jgi:hypothetical protein|tara:strand:+ start:528 stop:653 length:126 start_codon:yes stop_codon:yes gene_type:complete